MNIEQLHLLFLNSTGVFTDTRSIKSDGIFFALKGERFNGNKFAKNAIAEGAAYAIIDEKEFQESDRYILVDNVLKTLQELATYHRDYLEICIIGLTGSNGKTTTKELINEVLSTSYKTTATKGNLNNHIGVPLTLLSMDKETEIGIVEMGANHIGEIDLLCRIAKPNYGYITNIGKAHLEGFGSIEGVLKGKTELYRYLRNQNLVFLNADDNKLSEAAGDLKTYTFSQEKDNEVQVKLITTDPMVSVQYKNHTIKSNLIGTYNFPNIAAAICIGSYFKVTSELIAQAIERYTPKNNRSQIIKKGNTTIILDAYNANPTSMQAALHNFKQLPTISKTIFLGDMFELGEDAKKEHQEIAHLATETNADFIYLLGSNFYETTVKDSRIIQCRTYEDLQQNWHPEHLGESILIKGSRGMKLERILDLIES